MIDYQEDWLFKLLFQARGSVAFRACTFAIPSAIFSVFLVLVDDWAPELRRDLGLQEPSKSTLWTATTAVLGTLLVFRTNRAMARFWEGTGLLHQMRGEWFDSISCCVTFSIGAIGTKRMQVKRFRHTIVRLMSLCHGSALEEIAGNDSEHVETIDCLGLDNTTLCYLKACKEELNFNRVEVLLHLTQSIITKSLDDGILQIPPPILSRVYQTLSRGFVNLLNAKKIADTRFPFPYAQLIAMLLFMNLLLTPIMISCMIPNKVWAPIFTFVPLFGMFSLNFIGIELENPFGRDENDLPLEHFQSEMNKCLLMLLHEGADIIADVSDSRCIMKYGKLAASMEMVHTSLTAARFGAEGRSARSFTNWTEVNDIYDGGDFNRWCSTDKDEPINPLHVGTQPSLRSRSTRPSTASIPAAHMPEPLSLLEEKTDESIDMMNRISTLPPALSSSTQKNLGSANQSIEPRTAAPTSEPFVRLEEKDGVGIKNILPGATELVEKQVSELTRAFTALKQFSDALHGIVDQLSKYADRNTSSGGRMDFEKDGGKLATTLLVQPNASFAYVEPFSPVQQGNIDPLLMPERTGPVSQSVRCHPSSRLVVTPRQVTPRQVT